MISISFIQSPSCWYTSPRGPRSSFFTTTPIDGGGGAGAPDGGGGAGADGGGGGGGGAVIAKGPLGGGGGSAELPKFWGIVGGIAVRLFKLALILAAAAANR